MRNTYRLHCTSASDTNVPPSAHRTTLQDIADQVKLSRSSVALALRTTQSECPLNPATWALIQDAALRLNYRPNRLALSLARGKAGCIGILAERTPNLGIFSGRLIQHLGQSFSNHSQEILLIDASGPTSTWVGKLCDGRVDGAIMVPPSRPLSRAQWADIQIPVIGLNLPLAESGVTSIIPNETQAVDLLVAHLHELGHRKFAFFQDFRTPISHFSTHARQNAFIANTLITSLGRKPMVLTNTGECLDAARHGKATAFIGYSDLDALMLMTAAMNAGLRIPKDLSIAGINDDPYVSLISPAMTTVSLEPVVMAETACQVLMDSLSGSPRVAQEIQITTHLRIRASTAAPPSSAI